MYQLTNSLRRIRSLVIALAWFASACGRDTLAQYPTVDGQNSQASFGQGLITSPEVGDLEGIQRFGRTLRTDPDPGMGYTYRVFPSQPRQAMDQESFLWAFAHVPEVFDLKAKYHQLAGLIQLQEKQPTPQLELKIAETQLEIANLQLALRLALGGSNSADWFSRYAPGRNPTDELRLPFSSELRSGAFEPNGYSVGPTGMGMGMGVSGLGLGGPGMGGLGIDGLGVGPMAFGAPGFDAMAMGAMGFGGGPNLTKTTVFNDIGNLYHQPLIQIKVRIIEATRLNSADFRSVLDYISRQGTASLVQGNNINGNRRSTRAVTRLPTSAGVLDTPNPAELPNPNTPWTGLANLNDGSGALINLTTEHLNFVTNMLVTEFSGDVLTVPEVTTLNGQNVEFVAGDNRPLPLGLTTVSGKAAVTQEFFYKHIGTLVSVTPRIVNWGRHLEGNGEAPIVAQEIDNWNRLADWMTDGTNLHWEDPREWEDIRRLGASNLPVPIELKTLMLSKLEQYPARTLRERFWAIDAAAIQKHADKSLENSAPDSTLAPVVPASSQEAVEGVVIQDEMPQLIFRQPNRCACDWKPEDCTIDLEIVVRESNLAPGAKEAVNSIANIIQVKSGHGAVMGGLIGNSEIESVSKIPLLGDLPAVGYFFRSKAVDRAKTELLIVVEARVLPNDRAREETSRDFQLARAYVAGALRDNPLELGMYRAGFDQYLPPASICEEEYWMKHEVKMRKVATEFDDIFK